MLTTFDRRSPLSAIVHAWTKEDALKWRRHGFASRHSPNHIFPISQVSLSARPKSIPIMLNYYAVLALPTQVQKQHTVTKQDIKIAYRRALLQHHPDKSSVQESPPLAKPKYTVDEVTTAYKILSDASARSEFDRQLRLYAAQFQKTAAKPLSGLETVDLDDLEYDDAAGVWYRSCRCGNKRGYLITEDDLEKEAEHGDIVTGCGGCSIWLKVLFQSVEGA